MDHADVLDRLASAFSEPGKLASIDADQSAEGQELRRHLETCDACRHELEAWRLTSEALAVATPDTLRAPAEARARVLATVAAMGVARGGAGTAVAAPPRAEPPEMAASAATPPSIESPRRAPPTFVPPELTALPGGAGHAAHLDPAEQARSVEGARPATSRLAGAASDRFRFRWLAVAAAVAVLLFVGGALLGPRLGLTQEPPGEDLARVVTAMNSIIQQPDHLAVALRTADGGPGGSVLLDPASGNLVIVSTALVPGSSQTYDCFVVRGAAKTKIGLMHFSDQTSYWVGKVALPTNPGQPGDSFEVRLGGATGVLSLSGNF